MAQYPCDFCAKRYTGQQQTIYPALVHGTTRVGEKRRLCPECFEHAFAWCALHLSTPTEVSFLRPDECSLCHAVMDKRIAVFVTVYGKGTDRQDFFGQICDDCVPESETALLGPERAPRRVEPLMYPRGAT